MVRQSLIKKIEVAILLVAVSGLLICAKCNNRTKSTAMNKQTDRIQKIVERDANGHIIKTYDGFVYRIFDELGRQIEWYGNYRSSENNSNFRVFVGYSDSVIVAREYVLEDDNIKCKVINEFDCGLTKYYYKGKKLFKREDYMRIFSDKDVAIGHRLLHTEK